MKRTPSPYLILLIFTTLAALSFTTAGAQEPTREPSDNEINAVAKQLYCPVCENIPLDVCPTQACAQWRGLIREKMSQGWTDEQIITYFVDQYGDRVLAEPPRRGLNWLVYIVPPVLFAIGIYILYRAFKVWRQPSAQLVSSEKPDLDAPHGEYVKRIEEELRRRQ